MCGVLGLKISSERALMGVTKFGGMEFLGVELSSVWNFQG